MSNAPLVLVVEHDADIRALLKVALEEHGYRVATAPGKSPAVEFLRATRPDLMVAAVVLRDHEGEHPASIAEAMNIPVLRMSGAPSAIERYEGGTVPFLRKPFRLAELEQAIERLLRTPSQAGERHFDARAA